MLEINTIQDFFALSPEQRGDICRNIKTVDRLKDYLRSLNIKKEAPPPQWIPCKKCETKGWVYEEHEERNNADIHASTIHKCLKHIWYNCAGYSDQAINNITPEGRLVFDHGHALHHMFQSYGRRGAWGSPSDYQAEVTILPTEIEAIEKKTHVLPEAIKYRVRSSVDAVLWKYVVPNVRGLGDVSVRLIHEYKSIGPGKPKKDGTLFGGFADLKGPKVEHKQQIAVYQHCLNVPIAVVIYYDKGFDRFADFPVPYDSITWNYVRGRIDRVLQLADTNTIPPWEETSAVFNPSECSYCEFAHICKPPRNLEMK